MCQVPVTKSPTPPLSAVVLTVVKVRTDIHIFDPALKNTESVTSGKGALESTLPRTPKHLKRLQRLRHHVGYFTNTRFSAAIIGPLPYFAGFDQSRIVQGFQT